VEHRAAPAFWRGYRALEPPIRRRADKQFSFLKANTQHPSLQFKKIGERQGEEIWSARVTLHHRALALKRPYGYLWFWIGEHETYETLIV
jgi:hypothetical protein